MGAIVGKGKNNGVIIYTNDIKSDNLIFVFHGTPLTRYVAEIIQEIETKAKTTRKVYMPYTQNSTSIMSRERLIKEMDKYYQLTKKDLLKAKTIDVVAHSYGPVKALAFLHAIAKDKKSGPQILAKVKNLHLYNAMIKMEWDSSHRLAHNIKLFIFRIRIFLASLLRWEENYETPDVVKSLINLKSEVFKPTTFIAYNPDDIMAPSSEEFMKKVRVNLRLGDVSCAVTNDSKWHRYPKSGRNHSTSLFLVERFTLTEAKIAAQHNQVNEDKILDL